MGLVDGLKKDVSAARKREKARGSGVFLRFGDWDVGNRQPLGGHSRSERVGEFRGGFIGKVGDFIDKAPVEGFLSREPAADFHQGEQVLRLALAPGRIELGAVQVELVKVGLDLLAVGDKRGELVGVQTAPLEEGHRAFMHEVHGPGIDGDVDRAERSDGSGGGIESHEMYINIAVVAESSGDRQAGGE